MKNSLRAFLVFSLSIASTLIGGIASELDSLIQIDCSVAPVVRLASQQLENRTDRGSYTHIAQEEGTSLNWSGYAAATSLSHPQNNAVTAVSGSWTVPKLSHSTTNTYSAFWVGIDGYSSGTVEQIGTEHDWLHGSQSNYAWFEMYPSGTYEIVGFPVDVFDQIEGEVAYKGENVFQLTLVNYTKNVYTVIPTSYTRSASALRSSAEWIVEAPYLNTVLPLAHFGAVAFTNCSATLLGYTGAINSSHWASTPLTMISPSGVIKSLPSGLSAGGKNFTLTWEHE